LTSPTVQANAGTKLIIDDTGTNLADRISDTADLALNGGTFQFIGNSAGSPETVGNVKLLTNISSTIQMQPTGTGNLTLNATNLVRAAGATVQFIGTNVDIGSATTASQSRIFFSGTID